MREITAKQRSILEFIIEFTNDKGYPPSIREICAAVNLKSPSSVHAHIKALQDKGYINKDDRKTRALTTAGSAGAFGKVPILGRVTAGQPILAVEDVEGYLPFDSEGAQGQFFALRVEGESMIGAGIMDGDFVVVRKQQAAMPKEIVVALLGDEATVKRLSFENNHVWLLPENPEYEPIDGEGCQILGVVVALFRRY